MFSGILRTPSTNKNPFTGEGGFLCHLSALWRFFIYWCPHPLQWWEERVIRTNVNTGLIAQVGESYRHTTRNILTNARESVKYTDWFQRTHSNQEKSRETIHSINIHQSKLPIRRQTSRVGSDFNTLHKLESLQIIAPCTFWVLSWFFIRCQPHNGDKCCPCISLPSSAIRQPWSENPQWHLTPDPQQQLLQSAKIETRADVVRH